MIVGEKLCFRPLNRAHIAAWLTWVNDPEIAGLLDRVLPVTVDEHAAFYQRAVVENRRAVWFAVYARDCEVHIGNAWLWDIDERHRRAEVRIVIGVREYWQRGVGAEAIEMIADYALRSLGLHKVYAYVMHRNPRAKSAFEKAGFGLEATLKDECFWDGGFQDVWRMAVTATARSIVLE